MLVFSRTKGESFLIGDDIEITLIEIRGDKARIGIVAPKTTPVHRREVYDARARAAKPFNPGKKAVPDA